MTDHINQCCAAVMRAARIKAGVSQPKMADHLGCTRRHVQNIEANANSIRVVDLARWSRACGLSAHILLQRAERIAKQRPITNADARRFAQEVTP